MHKKQLSSSKRTATTVKRKWKQDVDGWFAERKNDNIKDYFWSKSTSDRTLNMIMEIGENRYELSINIPDKKPPCTGFIISPIGKKDSKHTVPYPKFVEELSKIINSKEYTITSLLSQLLTRINTERLKYADESSSSSEEIIQIYNIDDTEIEKIREDYPGICDDMLRNIMNNKDIIIDIDPIEVEYTEEPVKSINEEIVEIIIEEPVKTIAEEQVKTITEEQVKTINGEIVETNTEEPVKTIAEEQVKTITEEQVKTINGEIVETNTEEPVKPITEEIVETNTEEPVKSITEEIVETNTEEPVKSINEEIVETNIEEPVKSNTEESVKTITEEPVKTITEEPVNTITEEPVKITNEEIVETITEEPVNTITEEPVETIIEESVNTIIEEQLDTINEEPVNTITEEPVKTITEEPVKTITEELVETIIEESVNTISEEQLDTITEEPVDTINKEPVDTITEQLETVNNVPLVIVTKSPVELTNNTIINTSGALVSLTASNASDIMSIIEFDDYDEEINSDIISDIIAEDDHVEIVINDEPINTDEIINNTDSLNTDSDINDNDNDNDIIDDINVDNNIVDDINEKSTEETESIKVEQETTKISETPNIILYSASGSDNSGFCINMNSLCENNNKVLNKLKPLYTDKNKLPWNIWSNRMLNELKMLKNKNIKYVITNNGIDLFFNKKDIKIKNIPKKKILKISAYLKNKNYPFEAPDSEINIVSKDIVYNSRINSRIISGKYDNSSAWKSSDNLLTFYESELIIINSNKSKILKNMPLLRAKILNYLADLELLQRNKKVTEKKATKKGHFVKGTGFGHEGLSIWDINADKEHWTATEKHRGIILKKIVRTVTKILNSDYKTKFFAGSTFPRIVNIYLNMLEQLNGVCSELLLSSKDTYSNILLFFRILPNNIFDSLLDVESYEHAERLYKIFEVIIMDIKEYIEISKKLISVPTIITEWLVMENKLALARNTSKEVDNNDNIDNDELIVDMDMDINLNEIYKIEMKGLEFMEYSTKEPTTNMTKDLTANEVIKEMKKLSKAFSDSNCYDSSIFYRINENNIRKHRFMITGPKDTPYESGCIIFDVYCPPEFPKINPKITCHTSGANGIRYGPNLYDNGKVCMTILGTFSGNQSEKWIEGTSSIHQIAISIQSMMLVEKPYFCEPGHASYYGTPEGENKSRDYNNNIRMYTMESAILRVLKNPPEEFEDVIKKHFTLKADRIKETCAKWVEEAYSSTKAKYVGLYTEIVKHLNRLQKIE
jgi:ubiquitin-protein ligase